MTAKPIHHAQEILGYTLDQRIGAGGFGEVWSATAPGGMKKALKIVYGFHDEKRAQAELKALDRVKEVRHPFLLSLERIEVFEGQLIVVSELADKSLADLFNEYAAKGEPGIPREMLLKYVSNTAEALDYLASEFSLQHLDVKPENLLVVSGHVKVADFGLMKDLRAESQSLMQGMTPAYAAPELFDGQPSPKSDQYSLAIVYQEMLTGVRPFPGTTPAQLAAQHMHGKPNLRPLPRSDQAAMARALSKDPGVRYSSCVDMVADLLKQRRTVRKALKRATPVRDSESTDLQTSVVNGSDSFLRDVTEMMSGGSLPFQPTEISTIAPPECDEQDAVCRPTLIVSVGSTANKISQKIKSGLNSRLGSMNSVPAIQSVCIDSDRNDLTQLTMKGDDSIDSSEIVSTPVKKAEAYREKTNNLKWLGRRWIYNVPRTLQTEGLRPLGRLVFADHFEAICERLESTIKELAKPELLAKTCDTLGLSPGNVLQPRVFIVSSISGGIGSGMVLDLAYTIRLLLAENGLESSGLNGVLLHSSYQRNRDPGLSAANSFAFLTEMRHFNDNGYPGDQTLGIPEFDDEPPFEYTYFTELGHDLNQSQFDTKLNEVAEYISLAAMSPCSAFFDACQKAESNIEHFALRTFGLSLTGPGNQESGKTAVNRLGCGLINRWINGDVANPKDNEAAVGRLFRKHNLSHETILQSMESTTEMLSELTLDQQTDEVIALVKSQPENLLVSLVELLDSFYGRPPQLRDSAFEEPEICVKIEELITSEAIKDGSALNEDINVLLDGNTIAICDIVETVDGARTQFKHWSDSMMATTEELGKRIIQTGNYIKQLASEPKLNDKSLQMLSSAIADVCKLRREEFTLRYSRVFVRVLSNSLESAKTIAMNLRRSLDFVMTEFAYEEMLTNFDPELFDMDQLMSMSVHQDADEQIKKLEIQIYESLIKDMGGFESALTESNCWQRKLPNDIRAAAQRILADAYEKISLEEVIDKNGIAPEKLIQWLNTKIQSAKPKANDCGGETRMLVGLPKYSSGTRIPDLVANNFRVDHKMIRGTSGNMVLCFEGENLSIAAVAFRLLAARPDAVELVKRIHTRNDVEWSTLNDLL